MDIPWSVCLLIFQSAHDLSLERIDSQRKDIALGTIVSAGPSNLRPVAATNTLDCMNSHTVQLLCKFINLPSLISRINEGPRNPQILAQRVRPCFPEVIFQQLPEFFGLWFSVKNLIPKHPDFGFGISIDQDLQTISLDIHRTTDHPNLCIWDRCRILFTPLPEVVMLDLVTNIILPSLGKDSVDKHPQRLWSGVLALQEQPRQFRNVNPWAVESIQMESCCSIKFSGGHPLPGLQGFFALNFSPRLVAMFTVICCPGWISIRPSYSAPV